MFCFQSEKTSTLQLKTEDILWDLLHLLENTYDQKRISAKPSPNQNLNFNTKSNLNHNTNT